MLENLRSKLYYKVVGVLSWILAPYIMYLWGTPSFAAIGAGIVAVLLTIVLVILYLLLLIIAAIDSKRLVKKSTKLFFDIGYILAFIPILYLLFNYIHYLLSR
jgi:hypothetical protein